MDSRIRYYWYGVLFIGQLLLGHTLFGQQTVKAYFFDGDEVVFEFDRRDYARAIQEGTSEQLDFNDLNIHEVIVSGAFNDWSKEGWEMKRKNRNRYQLRKKIEDFNDVFSWEFKFLVNGQYWVEPELPFSNRKMLSNDFLEEVYDLNLYNIEPSKDGNTLFSLMGYEQAAHVILTGNFNGWNEHQLEMEKVTGGWQIRIDLPPGRYEYKFIADREWLHDPANENKARNEHGTFNSILLSYKTITFELEGFPEAERVILAGSFNEWNEKKTRMSQQNGIWTISLDLPAGKHHYKFIVDGQWMTDPRNAFREKDRHGNVNSVLIVQ